MPEYCDILVSAACAMPAQTGAHDSVDDARAALDLVKLKLQRGEAAQPEGCAPMHTMPATSSSRQLWMSLEAYGVSWAAECFWKHGAGKRSRSAGRFFFCWPTARVQVRVRGEMFVLAHSVCACARAQ